MACYHPLKAFNIGLTETGKNNMLITSHQVDHLEWNGRLNRWEKIFDKELKNPYADQIVPYCDIPCGKCIGCRLDYSRSWATRCVLELQEHSSSYFCTFTYDDYHLRFGKGIVPETGEIVYTPTLQKRDWQLFMKRLRKAYEKKYPDEKLKYFAAGEYGDSTFRPHMHSIIFGLKLDDLVFYKKQGDFNYYTSEWLSSIWSVPGSDPPEPLGFVVVAEACYETAAYTARYITKKLNGTMAQAYDILGIEPEFALMSRRPGIAGDYVDRNISHLMDDKYLYISTYKEGLKLSKPKFFKRKYDAWFEESDPDEFYKYKLESSEVSLRAMESIKQLQCQSTNLSYLDLLSVEEAEKKSRIKALERRL